MALYTPSIIRKMKRYRFLFLSVSAIVFIFFTLGIIRLLYSMDESAMEEIYLTEPVGVSGIFQFSAYHESGESVKPLRHTSIYVNGPDYTGMEDNDIRGFLDGRFRNGWNQPGQSHVRVGRRE